MPLHVRLDPAEVETTLVRFIADYTEAAGVQDAVIGLSGGIDSAVVASLAVTALGADHVHAFALPSTANAASDLDDARAMATHLGIPLHEREIQPIVDAFVSVGGHDERGIVANAMARARMMVLYGEAQHRGAIVLGTGNKSELLIGYFTKYGDGGTDLLPIGDLYKTQVRELARHLGVPQALITKPPTAGLWAGQTDEAEMGITYDALDKVLLGLEIGLDHDRIAGDAGVSADEVGRIETIRRRTAHKRDPPLVCKLGIRSLGSDWRDPVTGTGDTPEG